MSNVLCVWGVNVCLLVRQLSISDQLISLYIMCELVILHWWFALKPYLWASWYSSGLTDHLTFYSAQRLDLFAWCVRLSRLLVGFRTHFKSLHFLSFFLSLLHTVLLGVISLSLLNYFFTESVAFNNDVNVAEFIDVFWCHALPHLRRLACGKFSSAIFK